LGGTGLKWINQRFNNFFRRAANTTAMPLPTRKRLAGSGTGVAISVIVRVLATPLKVLLLA
jgi:hypothetical protein